MPSYLDPENPVYGIIEGGGLHSRSGASCHDS
jgi:hypothetical protein